MLWDPIKIVDERNDAWVRQLQELVRIPSPFEHEHAIIRYVKERLEKLGLAVIHVPMMSHRLHGMAGAQRPFSEVAGRDNLIVCIPGSGGGKSLILNSHLDIVPEGNPDTWTYPPFSGHIDHEKNVIYGRGVMDDKAGVAIALAVAELMLRRPKQLAGDIILQFVLEDEITGNGSLVCLDAGHTGDAAIILDGTRLARAVNEHAGNMQFKLNVKGKPVSVSVAHVGANAAEMLAGLVLHLKQTVLGLNPDRREPWTRFPSPNQFVVQSFHCDEVQLTVPDKADAVLYAMFTPPHTLRSMVELIEQEAAKYATAHEWPFAPVFDWAGFAAEPVKSSAGKLEALVARHAATQGIEAIDFGPSTGTSDMRHFCSHNIPCLVYGPGGGFNPHRADEHYQLDDLPRMVKLLTGVIEEWCG